MIKLSADQDYLKSCLERGGAEDIDISIGSDTAHIGFRIDEINGWIEAYDIGDLDPEKYLDYDNLEDVSQENTYIEVGGVYTEENDFYRFMEVRPVDFSIIDEELRDAVETVLNWDREKFEIYSVENRN